MWVAFMNVNSLIIIFILSVAGVGLTGHLIYKRKTNKKLFCPTGEDCSKVLTSKYNKTLGIYKDMLGFIFYALVFL